MRICVLWSVLALVCACVESPPSTIADGSEEASSAGPQTVIRGPDPVPASARPCSDELFFIDVPHGIALPTHTELEALPNKLVNLINGQEPDDWFCANADCKATVRMRAVLPKRTEPAWRADGHLRFFRFHFEDPSEPGERLKLLPGMQCNAISAIRQAARTALKNDSVYVGRVCSGSTAGVEAYASAEMLNWHLERIDVQHPPGQPLSAGTESLVDVAIIDTGIESYLNATLQMDLVDATRSAPLHHHGTAMALLVQQIAPSATIHDYRVMDESGFGIPADVATAFDDALFELGGSRPLVVNMSLGWPAELGRPSLIEGPRSLECYEDPVGEPVRYLMNGAAQRSDVTLVIAAGNQPARSGDDIFPPEPSSGVAPMPNLNSFGWFYPAEWTHTGTPGSSFPRGVAVSATDVRNEPVTIAIPGTETRLVAPGQHVYVTHDDAPRAPEVRCTGGQSEIVFGPREFRSPSSMTGTSVAAALVSGAAALVQRESIMRTGAALDTEFLQSVLYASGLNLGRGSIDGYDVRLLNIERMKTLLSCEDALACLVQYPLNDCLAVFAGCGVPIASAPAAQTVAWPWSFAEAVDDCPVSTIGGFQICGSGICEYERKPNRILLGDLGPQPQDTSDIEPGIFMNSAAKSTHGASNGPRLVSTLNDRLATPQTSGSASKRAAKGGLSKAIKRRYLVLEGYDFATGQSETHYVDLKLDGLAPGQTAVVDFENSLPKLDWTTAKATLVTEIEQQDALPSTDYAPVRILE